MYHPKKPKKGHAMSTVSRKTMNRFIDCVLRVMAAKPFLYFHQTLSFPNPDFQRPMNDPKRAKETFNRFIKGVIKHYGRYDMAGLYVQERRHDGTYHFHVCFLFFSPNNLPYAPTRMYRDMKTDIFKRWKKLNAEIDKCSRGGNDLTEHQFNLDSAGYFCRAVIVADATVRKETNWFGIFNWHLVSNRSI